MSVALTAMEREAAAEPGTELTNLAEDALISIILKLDLQSMVMVARATKIFKQVIENELVWMELCQPWENLVNVKSWRVHMDSWKALYRLLHSLNKLVGLWSHRGSNPCGELLYVTWVCSLLISVIHFFPFYLRKMGKVSRNSPVALSSSNFTNFESYDSVPGGRNHLALLEV